MSDGFVRELTFVKRLYKNFLWDKVGGPLKADRGLCINVAFGLASRMCM